VGFPLIKDRTLLAAEIMQFNKIFNSLVQIMLATMRIFNYSSLFSHTVITTPNKNKYCLRPYYLSAILHYMQLKVREHTCSYVCQPFLDIKSILPHVL
jgi:hypothetical protein